MFLDEILKAYIKIKLADLLHTIFFENFCIQIKNDLHKKEGADKQQKLF